MRVDIDPGTFNFIPLAHSHLPVIGRWLTEPHVARWYDSPAAALGHIECHIDEPEIECFLVQLDGRSIGYIQAYDPHAYPNHPYRDQAFGTRGIDQFIGEPELVGCGHGPRFIRKFILRLFDRGVPRVVTDPDPENIRAVRAYEKAGFLKQRLVDTPDGLALLMVRNA